MNKDLKDIILGTTNTALKVGDRVRIEDLDNFSFESILSHQTTEFLFITKSLITKDKSKEYLHAIDDILSLLSAEEDKYKRGGAGGSGGDGKWHSGTQLIKE